ncbi:alpha/beta family hydrolase [Lapillicoccus jejuensis]|uniref:KANL3/Tex30 alpha/beta hydrolase-like domain-containing protein n=1 Tax=Lapillicoccus jejuensis TaxID=402171 RepID=A0A542DW59_9MICO|nr:alpha/beta family hydrolase [Lapillicoccus jejuensis]TQJ07285.1 hypothetical protein FB458_0343 [Lapillicoccus jejuensis]
MTASGTGAADAVVPGAEVHGLDTPYGVARAHVRRPRGARGTAVLGHGAGGGLGSVDLRAALDALHDGGWATVLVEQPWLVAGRRVATPPPTLDAAWVPVVTALTRGRGRMARVPGPLLLGGRSAGARVACRTAAALGADAVLCLSFPLHPPGRPDRSRAGELALVVDAGTPVLVVQGERDPFGGPDDVAPYVPVGCVQPVAGTHTVARGAAGRVREVVAGFAASLTA